VTLIIFLTLLFVIGIKQNTEDYINNHSVQDTSDYGVMAWLDAFTSKDFDTCDQMASGESDMLYSGQVLGMIGDISYYNETLSKLVDCISSIQVESIDSDGVGNTYYFLRVTYTPYREIYALDVDDSSIYEAEDLYLSGDDTQFDAELSQVYLEIFKTNCFIEDDEAITQQQVLTLSEKEVNGVTRVYGTASFVDSLLSDSNISHNIEFYENDVKEKINNIIKAF
jgi:hypothetical protein